MHIGGMNTAETMATIAVVVGGLVRVLKIPAIAKRVPKKALPWVSLGLGVAAGLVVEWQEGHLHTARAREWLQAVFEGALSGYGAVGGYETLAKALRAKPKEPPKP